MYVEDKSWKPLSFYLQSYPKIFEFYQHKCKNVKSHCYALTSFLNTQNNE